MKIITIPVGDLETNCYIIHQDTGKDAVVIDPGAEPEIIQSALVGLNPVAVLLTHGHFDHTGALHVFSHLPIYIHSMDSLMLTDSFYSFGGAAGDFQQRPGATGFVAEGQPLSLGGIQINVLHTPGHTRGSVCYQVGNDIFTGDTLFKGDHGRTDLPGGSEQQMRASLRRLFAMHGCRIYPGHGPGDTIK